MSDFKDADIVVAIKSTEDGKIVGHRIKIYVKDGNDFEQIGLVQEFSIHAEAHMIGAYVQVTFPLEIEEMSDVVKNSIRKNSSLLAEKGCLVTLK